jgi:hypothetical protein
MAEYGYFPVSDTGLMRVRSKLDQMRLGGKTVAPYEYSKLMEAEIGAQADRGDRRYSENLANERFEKSLAENKRQANIREGLTREQLDAAKGAMEDANTGALIGAAFKAPAAISTAAKLFEEPNEKTGAAGGIGYKLYKKMFGGPGSVTPTSGFINPNSGGSGETGYGFGTTAEPEMIEPMRGPDPYLESYQTDNSPMDFTDFFSRGESSYDNIGDNLSYNDMSYPDVSYEIPDVSYDYPITTENVELPLDADYGNCIIVTALHGRHSPEVNIARLYRDTFMTARQIRGYYILAEKTVRLMRRSAKFKQAVKGILVDNLIKYGKSVFSCTRAPLIPLAISKSFLALCDLIGTTKKRYVRSTGEVY